MHKWILQDEQTTQILCSECATKKYPKLFMRKQWQPIDLGKKFTCALCREPQVLMRVNR